MNEEIFRKKSLDKVKSPENLDDYIRVSNPGVWLLLISVIVLLAGACVWGVFGHIDSTLPTAVRVENGDAVCIVADGDFSAVREGMTVRFDGWEAVITGIGQKEERGYVCKTELLRPEQTIPDGVYEGKIVIKSVKPISFVLN